MTSVLNETSSDLEIWEAVLDGNVPAFEVLVRRHQPLVSAVAYNACENLAMSEDVTQETFWAAWRDRQSLREPRRLREWLCGIARNQGKDARRRALRPANATSSLELATELSGNDSDPAELAVSREEETLIWQTLEQIPELYREPLILFYREQESVADVAEALGLSQDVVKQRLSRGRGILREQMASFVEGALRRSRPGAALTIAIMTGLTSLSTGSKTVMAGATVIGTGVALPTAIGATAKVTAGTWGIAGVASGLIGPLVGFLGGWLGCWLPATTRRVQTRTRTSATSRTTDVPRHDGVYRRAHRIGNRTTVFPPSLFVLMWGAGLLR